MDMQQNKLQLKSRDEMYGFINKTWFYLQNVVCWGWEKPNTKKISAWLTFHPHFYDMEADCFPVSKNAENKPNLP